MNNQQLDLHQQFVRLGRQRNKLTYQLLALIPKIFAMGIYKKHGCATIEEYAGKFAGLSKSVVQKRLRLERHLSDKPVLRKLIGQEGVHKVALVASLATAETEKAWADKVRHMSKGTSEKHASYCNFQTSAANASPLLDVSSFDTPSSRFNIFARSLKISSRNHVFQRFLREVWRCWQERRGARRR